MNTSTLNTLEGLIPWMGLADRIKEAMGDMSPAEFATACHVTAASVTFWLNGSTKSLRAEKAALMEAATGYRAGWIVTGKGPKKVSESARPTDTAELPLSPELQQRVLRLSGEELFRAENILRILTGLPPKIASAVTNTASDPSSAMNSGTYSGGTEDDVGLAPDIAVPPTPKKHEQRKTDHRSARKKGGGGA